MPTPTRRGGVAGAAGAQRACTSISMGLDPCPENSSQKVESATSTILVTIIVHLVIKVELGRPAKLVQRQLRE